MVIPLLNIKQMKGLSVHSKQKARGAVDWDAARKTFPEEIQAIQDWWNRVTGSKSQIKFYQQPIWQNDMAIKAIFDLTTLQIETEPRFVAETNDWRYIYALHNSDIILE